MGRGGGGVRTGVRLGGERYLRTSESDRKRGAQNLPRRRLFILSIPIPSASIRHTSNGTVENKFHLGRLINNKYNRASLTVQYTLK